MSGRHRADPLRPRRGRGTSIVLAPIVGIAALVLASTTDGSGAPDRSELTPDFTDPSASGVGDSSALLPLDVPQLPALPLPAGPAARVIELTNDERADAGCAPLRSDAALTRAAQAHSEAMARDDFFAHTDQRGDGPGERISDTGYRWSAVAENIAAGQRTPEQVVAGWMASPGHRANILDCGLTEIGVGHSGTYWVQDFGTPG